MINTEYRLLDDEKAAEWLCMDVKELRYLRDRGEGPAFFRLPNAEIRYRFEDVKAWAGSGNDLNVLHVRDGADVIPFPGSGVKVRRHLPSKRKPKVPPRRKRGWY